MRHRPAWPFLLSHASKRQCVAIEVSCRGPFEEICKAFVISSLRREYTRPDGNASRMYRDKQWRDGRWGQLCSSCVRLLHPSCSANSSANSNRGFANTLLVPSQYAPMMVLPLDRQSQPVRQMVTCLILQFFLQFILALLPHLSSCRGCIASFSIHHDIV